MALQLDLIFFYEDNNMRQTDCSEKAKFAEAPAR